MNISTKGRYGLRAVLDLATNYGDRPIVLSTIAERQDISEGYLEQLMGPLKKAGIIASARGAQGGYYLAKDPKEIYVGEVFRALEGPLALVSCIGEAGSEQCERQDYCGSAFIWREIQDAVSSVLDRYTIYDLIVYEYGLAAHAKEVNK